MGSSRANWSIFVCLGFAIAIGFKLSPSFVAIAHARARQPCYPMHGYGALMPVPLQGLVTDITAQNTSDIISSSLVNPPATNSFVMPIDQGPTNSNKRPLWNLLTYLMDVCDFRGPTWRTKNFTCSDWTMGTTDLVINLQPQHNNVMLEIVSYPPNWLVEGFSCLKYFNHAPFNPAVIRLPFKGQKDGAYIFAGRPFRPYVMISGRTAELRIQPDPVTAQYVITFLYDGKIITQGKAIACMVHHCGLF